jgi:hypothetical protein
MPTTFFLLPKTQVRKAKDVAIAQEFEGLENDEEEIETNIGCIANEWDYDNM